MIIDDSHRLEVRVNSGRSEELHAKLAEVLRDKIREWGGGWSKCIVGHRIVNYLSAGTLSDIVIP